MKRFIWILIIISIVTASLISYQKLISNKVNESISRYYKEITGSKLENAKIDSSMFFIGKNKFRDINLEIEDTQITIEKLIVRSFLGFRQTIELKNFRLEEPEETIEFQKASIKSPRKTNNKIDFNSLNFTSGARAIYSLDKIEGFSSEIKFDSLLISELSIHSELENLYVESIFFDETANNKITKIILNKFKYNDDNIVSSVEKIKFENIELDLFYSSARNAIYEHGDIGYMGMSLAAQLMLSDFTIHGLDFFSSDSISRFTLAELSLQTDFNVSTFYPIPVNYNIAISELVLPSDLTKDLTPESPINLFTRKLSGEFSFNSDAQSIEMDLTLKSDSQFDVELFLKVNNINWLSYVESTMRQNSSPEIYDLLSSELSKFEFTLIDKGLVQRAIHHYQLERWALENSSILQSQFSIDFLNELIVYLDDPSKLKLHGDFRNLKFSDMQGLFSDWHEGLGVKLHFNNSVIEI